MPAIAAGLFVVSAPLLVMPELAPASFRTPLVVALTIAALAVALVNLRPSRGLAAAAGVLAVMVVVGWVRSSGSPPSLSHFSGVGLGLLVMSLVVALCRTERRLATATVIFAVAGLGVLLLGLMGTRKPPSKFFAAPELYEVLPRLMLGLPGLRSNGFVNLNALAGTALLIGPVAGALAIASRRRAQGRTLLAAAGWTAAAVALFVIFFSQSRSAWLASVVLGFVLTVRLCARWVRPWVIALAFLGVMLGSAAVVRAAWPQTYDRVASTALYSGDKRLAIYRQALHHVRTAPLAGIGLNEFRNVYEPPMEGRRRARPAAHAHDIFLQTALDIGLIGLAAYCGLLVLLLQRAHQASRGPNATAAVVAAGAGIAIAAGVLFGIADAIALGAKVGIFQWLAAGLILAAAALQKGSASPT